MQPECAPVVPQLACAASQICLSVKGTALETGTESEKFPCATGDMVRCREKKSNAQGRGPRLYGAGLPNAC
jgi:hypothetical protein